MSVSSTMSKTMNPVTVTATATATVLWGKIGRLASRQEIVVDKTNPFIGYFQKALQTPSTPPDRKHHQRFDWFNKTTQSSRGQPGLPFDLSRHETPTVARRPYGHQKSMPSLSTNVMNSHYATHFKELRVLGRGGQGKVYEVQSAIDNSKYAVKKIDIPGDGHRMKQALREVQVMAHLPAHRNIVRYISSWMEVNQDTSTSMDPVDELSDYGFSCNSFTPSYSECGVEFASTSNEQNYSEHFSMEKLKLSKQADSSKTLYIQMELCEQVREYATLNNLTTWLRLTGADRIKSTVLHDKAMHLFRDVVQGVQHLHAWGIIHRDIKPDNVFLRNGVAKVGDFGLSTSMHDDGTLTHSSSATTISSHTTAVGTFLYASPEQVGSGQAKTTYSEKSDIFGLGLILLELCCYFSTAMERIQVLTGARHGVLPATTSFASEMALVSSMTSLDPMDRPSADQILWMTSPQPSKSSSDISRLLFPVVHHV